MQRRNATFLYERDYSKFAAHAASGFLGNIQSRSKRKFPLRLPPVRLAFNSGQDVKKRTGG